ncbi:MAG TPA: OmpA family protein [Terriglobales bacterium]|nr:OmpA family protein [Terriglobales bacterium]
MKKLALVLMMLAAVALVAQQPAGPAPQMAATNLTQRVASPTVSDVYCSGFITNQLVPETNFVVAGWATPHQTKFADRDYIYMQGGSYADGTLLWVVRHLRDPNHYQAFPGQIAAISAVGEPYADMGRVRVVATRNNITIARVEFACDTMSPGDLVMSYSERTVPQYRRDVAFDRFAVPNGKLQGRIVMARDFDTVMGAGRKAYLNVGADQGVKIGDYFRVVRDYEISKMEPVDALSYKATNIEDTQKKPPVFPSSRSGELPRRSLGEAIVLSVSPKSSTVMLTYSLEEMLVGDHVEMEEPPPPLPPPVENPPTIVCSADPATVRVGESSRITSDASSPDNRPLVYSYSASAGSVAGENNTATLDTRGTGAGPISVKCTATDDRNLSASAMTSVNVEAPTQESRMSECGFNRTARVDNKCKAILDDVALQLQRDPDAKAVVIGQTGPGEAGGERLASQRAANTKAYLTKDKGLDGRRIEVRTGTGGGSKTDVWVVPAGASGPQ